MNVFVGGWLEFEHSEVFRCEALATKRVRGGGVVVSQLSTLKISDTLVHDCRAESTGDLAVRTLRLHTVTIVGRGPFLPKSHKP